MTGLDATCECPGRSSATVPIDIPPSPSPVIDRHTVRRRIRSASGWRAAAVCGTALLTGGEGQAASSAAPRVQGGPIILNCRFPGAFDAGKGNVALPRDQAARVFYDPHLGPKLPMNSVPGDPPLEIFGCAYGVGYPYRLGITNVVDGSSGSGISQRVLVGSNVALEIGSGSEGQALPTNLVVADLRNGRASRWHGEGEYTETTALLVSADGATGWIADNADFQYPGYTYVVDGVSPGGRVQQFEEGPIASEPPASSLKLVGNQLSWTTDDEPRSGVIARPLGGNR
jgi:hypothetical protein